MPQVLVAAGSNLDPEKKLKQALAALERSFGALKVSRAYQNEAVGFTGPDFINLVLGFDTTDSPSEVLAVLHEIEAACGRLRAAPKLAPRAMDLDILLYGDAVGEQPGLTLPRPDLARRPYMLGPAAEIAPDVVHPTLGKTLRQLWAEFEQSGHTLRPVEL